MDNLLTKQDRLRQLAAKIANTKADAMGKKNHTYIIEVTKIR